MLLIRMPRLVHPTSMITISAMGDRSVWPGLPGLMLRCGIKGFRFCGNAGSIAAIQAKPSPGRAPYGDDDLLRRPRAGSARQTNEAAMRFAARFVPLMVLSLFAVPALAQEVEVGTS